ncbi:Speckle-type POZ protein [Araneus ventricosus]|uniref:Speckle-type POZ protein n=1 Tax=Araneus ventricosus TaxID=182803 RepID=A0A4Y2L2W4_ARAVE|nr:Speckle-type POZ protein [Araneus ventricosus]
MNNGRKEYKLLWLIENYSYCWHQNKERLLSPKFNALDSKAWCLHLFPRGGREEDSRFIGIYLNRDEKDVGPESILLKCELSILAADGSTLSSTEYNYTFKRGAGYGVSQLVQIDEVLLRRRTDYLPQDTLTVCCKMWKDGGNIYKIEQSSARTRIGIEKISFLHVVENFAELEPNEKKTVHIQSPSKQNCDISSSIYFVNGSGGGGEIIAEIMPSDKNHILFKQKLSLLDASGNIIECGNVDNRFDATREDIRKLPLSLTRQSILNRKNDYLPNNELSVLSECTFSTGVELEKIEEIQLELPMVVLKQKCNNVHNKDGYNTAEKISACPSALDDLKATYNNKYLTDVELKTKTKSFPAHKVILCARSYVFKAMLTNDMKEKNSNFIQIDDLDDDTVHQLLLFLYSDYLENLQWESAMKLYYAGDKYAIEKMKVLCFSFLFNNLSVSTASELLLLADTHSDSDLKNLVEDFILKHEEEVFGSDEWENLIETNPQLVIKTMHLKYKRKKGGKLSNFGEL